MKKLKGANMDIDLTPSDKVSWEMDECPWNKEDKTTEHKCAVKNISLCKFFKGVEKPDTILCGYKEDE
tara:strand:+ start:597 stop:800 length:204 start_codon:yes stop_codon:yes gene_type:complete